MGMIVPIQGKTEEECLETLQALKENPYFPHIFAVELRYDLLERHVEPLSDFLRKSREIIGKKKLIFTIRTERQGGAFPFGKSYFQANILAMESRVPDYIDLEVEIGDEGRGPWKECIAMVQGLGGKVIASYHDFEKTPGLRECEEILNQLSSYSTDIVKIALMPRSKEDVLNLMLAGRRWKDRNPKRELISMSMGELGKASRVLHDLSGSSHSFVQVFSASAPGQWGIEDYMEVSKKLSGKKGLALLGFMGSGKSTLAPKIAERCGWQAYEMDRLLEEKFAMRIEEFFRKFGEEHFRREEAKLLRSLSGKEHVLSPGGGVVLREENRKVLREHFFSVYIKVSPETVLKRLAEGENVRPLLQGKMNVNDIGEMMRKRSAYYEEVADYILEGDGKSVSACVEEIYSVLLENELVLPL